MPLEIQNSARAAAQGRIKNLRPSMISVNPGQPRRIFDAEALFGLAESIRRYGVINPLTVRKVGPSYELIAGERRLRAAKLAGIKEVPCMVIEADEGTSSEMALIENLQRRDLDFFEEAMGYKRLIDVFDLTQEEAAERVGKTQSAVANKLRILRLPPEAIDMIRKEALSERHARALLRIPGDEGKMDALRHIVSRGLNVIQTEDYIESRLREGDRKAVEKHGRVKGKVRDIRLFVNTIDSAVATMQRAGVPAQIQKSESIDEIIFSIRIPRIAKRGAV